MADMQVTSDIWRWKGDAKRALVEDISIGFVIRLEEPSLFPPLVVGRFNLDGVISRCRQVP